MRMSQKIFKTNLENEFYIKYRKTFRNIINDSIPGRQFAYDIHVDMTRSYVSF